MTDIENFGMKSGTLDEIECKMSELSVNDANENKESISNPEPTLDQDKSLNQNINSDDTHVEMDDIRKWTKLFVGGLPFSSSDHALQDYFSRFGEIMEAVVIRDRKTGASKGYGFVTMREKKSAEKSVANPYPYIDGRRCNVNYAFLGAKKRNKYNMVNNIPIESCYHYIEPTNQYWSYSSQGMMTGQENRYTQPHDINSFYTGQPYQIRRPPPNMGNYRFEFPYPLDYNFAHPFPLAWPYGLAYSPGSTYSSFLYTRPHINHESKSTNNINGEIKNENVITSNQPENNKEVLTNNITTNNKNDADSNLNNTINQQTDNTIVETVDPDVKITAPDIVETKSISDEHEIKIEKKTESKEQNQKPKTKTKKHKRNKNSSKLAEHTDMSINNKEQK